MSGRRRRSESLWDRKEEEEMSGKVPYSSFRGDASPKHSNFEPNDSIPMDPAFDEWENQYNSRPSDNSYDLPYRSGDRGTGNMSKDRDRSRGRERDRERGSMRSRSRSRSRSRGRGSDERREFYESGGDSRVVSSRPCKDFAAGNCRRGVQCRFLHQEHVDSRGGGDLTEKYSGVSRFRDDRSSVGKGSDGYRKDSGRKNGGDRDRDHTTSSGDDYHNRGSNRNAYDDQDQRRQSTRAPCRFFMMGKCNRTNCKFSHDVPKSAGYEGRPHDNSRPWNERQPQDQSGFPDFDDKSKGWTGPTWNDLESGGFADNISDDKNRRTWDTNGSEKNLDILSQPRSDTNYMDMNQESQIIQSYSQNVMPETTSGGQNMASGQTNQQLHSYGSSDFLPSMDFQYPSTLNGTEKTSEMPSSNGSAQGMFLHPDLQKQTDIQPLETSKNDTDASKDQASQVSASLPQISPNLNLANALELLYSLPNTASSGAPVESMLVEQNEKASRDGVPTEQGNQVSSIDPNPPTKLDGKQEPVGNEEVKEGDKNENTNPGKSEAQGKVEEGNISNDEKAMRQFKVVLVEFVKEILKPTWKEGKMSREVYKTIVKKVVDKVTSTIQGNQIPRTQEKIDQYLAFSKSKITKLVEAYVGRFLKG